MLFYFLLLSVQMFRFLKTLLMLYGENRVSLMAGAISYFAFFSIFPFLLLLVTLLGLLDERLISLILEFVETQVPYIGSLISVNVSRGIRLRAEIGIIAIVGLLWGSFGVLFSLEYALNKIFKAKKHKSPLKIFVEYIMFFAVILVLLLFSVAAKIFVFRMRNIFALLNFIPDSLLSQQIAVFILGFVASIIAAFFTYKFIPNVKLRNRHVIIGAFVVALIFEIMNSVFGIYFNFANLSSTFGSFAPLAALLVWFYFSSIIFLIGALIIKTLKSG